VSKRHRPLPRAFAQLLPAVTSSSTRIRALIDGGGDVDIDRDVDIDEARARFSGVAPPPPSPSAFVSAVAENDQDSGVGNPIDSLLTFLTSDVGSIAFAFAGFLLLLVGRLVFDDDYGVGVGTTGTDGVDVDVAAEEAAVASATRSNLIAFLACGAVMVNGISKLDVQSRTAQAVQLSGTRLAEPELFFEDNNDDDGDRRRSESKPMSDSFLTWMSESLLEATPAETVAVLYAGSSVGNGDDGGGGIRKIKWQIRCLAGTVPAAISVPGNTPILDRFLSPTKTTPGGGGETYLPTLQALPGRTEFTYLPDNTQAVLLVPVPLRDIDDDNNNNSDDDVVVLVLGSNRARSFTPRDIAWCHAVAARCAVRG